MMKRYTSLLAPLLMLALWLCAMASSSAATMLVGENWLGSAHGQTPAQDLAAYGGSLYSTYSDEPTADGTPNRVRLLRYPWRSVTQAQVAAMHTKGLTWGIANEVGNPQQDGGLITEDQGQAFVVWYHDQVAAIRAADPTAKILGPSVLNFTNGYGPGYEYGVYSYDRLIRLHQARYGTPPLMDAMVIHYYPIRYELTSTTDSELAQQVGLAADYAAAHGWGLMVTEWGAWRTYFTTGCPTIAQTDDARYGYTLHGLQAMAARGVGLALYFGNVDAGCNENGHTDALFNADGSLTPPGRAHRDFALGLSAPSPTPLPTPTLPPSATTTVTRAPTLTSTPTLLVPTATPSRTPLPVVTATRTPVSGCVPTFVKRCP